MTKEYLKEFAEKNKHLLNDTAFLNTIIDQAYQAGQEAEREKQDLLNLINTKE